MSCLESYTETIESLRHEVEVLTTANDRLVDQIDALELHVEDLTERLEEMPVTGSVDFLRSAARDYFDTTREDAPNEHVLRTVEHMMERALEAAHA